MTTCRLIIDPPLPGAWNMAVDEALLEDAGQNGITSLRFYQWQEPTLSLGYFQPLEDRHQHAASRDCAIVRRQSGGGAILHDRELTYSVALPTPGPIADDPERLYLTVHDAIITTIRNAASHAGIRVELACWNKSSILNAHQEPFLCFQRRATGDVVIRRPGGPLVQKVVGSAQRRRRGALLQHGSILLETSPQAPELPGINPLTGLAITVDQVSEKLQGAIADALGWNIQPTGLPTILQDEAGRIQANKYDRAGWLSRR